MKQTEKAVNEIRDIMEAVRQDWRANDGGLTMAANDLIAMACSVINDIQAGNIAGIMSDDPFDFSATEQEVIDIAQQWALSSGITWDCNTTPAQPSTTWKETTLKAEGFTDADLWRLAAKAGLAIKTAPFTYRLTDDLVGEWCQNGTLYRIMRTSDGKHPDPVDSHVFFKLFKQES